MGKEELKPAKWHPLSDESIAQEYEWEYPKVKAAFGDVFPTLDHFKAAVKAGQVVPLDHATDSRIDCRSRTRSLDELKDLTSTYRYPRDVDRIARGLQGGVSLPTPIVLRHPETGRMRVMSGNTRLDTSFILGHEPHVTMVDLPSQKPLKKSGGGWRRLFSVLRGEPLEKGGAMKRKPFNPNDRDIEVDKKLHGWQANAEAHHRERLPRMEGNARDRALHKLAGQTKVLNTPRGRYFLLHRGMSGYEFDHAVNPDTRTVSHSDKRSSWTPSYATAQKFHEEYRNDYSQTNEPSPGVVSAWVHENNIVTVPKQYGQYASPEIHHDEHGDEADYDFPKTHKVKKPNYYAHEYEVVVDKGHKSHFTSAPASMRHDKGSRFSDINTRINDRGANDPGAFKGSKEREQDPEAVSIASNIRRNKLKAYNRDILHHKKFGLIKPAKVTPPEVD